MEGSRQFMIGDREFTYEESDGIFFMTGPTKDRVNIQEGCNTCGAKWQKASELKDSHCHFCGISNCKSCLMKTRSFRAELK